MLRRKVSRRLSWVLLLGFITATVVALIAGLAGLLISAWPPQVSCSRPACNEAREWIGASGALLVLIAGLYHYWNGQLWKRAEFLAQEMKDFMAMPAVRNALLMIDWSKRRINLFDSDEEPRNWPLVTRELQYEALLPHQVNQHRADADGDASDSQLAGYTREQAAIRDTFDVFLDGLEKFANYVSSGLVSAADLEPYLGYWINDIASRYENDAEIENDWTCLLLCYIAYYQYFGVQELFGKFGHRIAPGEAVFEDFLGTLRDRPLAQRLRENLPDDGPRARPPRREQSRPAPQLAG